MTNLVATPLENLVASFANDNLDLAYFIKNSEATNFEELTDYIEDQNGFDVEVIYYGSAMEYLTEHDASLSYAFELASEHGYQLENLNSEVLASLVASANLRDEYSDFQSEIEAYFEEIEEQEENDEEE